MPDEITQQERLFGASEVSYGAVTLSNGDLYPFLGLANALVSECKLRHDGDVFSIMATDPSSVGMVSVELDVETDLKTEFTVGVNTKELANILQNKPRGNDPVDVTVDFHRPQTTISVENEYANGTVWNVTERVKLIDPDSVRSEPDLPELDLSCEVEVSVPALQSYLGTRPSGNPIKFEPIDGGLRIGQINTDSDSSAEYNSTMQTDDVSVSGDATAMYSHDYLKDIFKALSNAGIETVTIQWGDEFPNKILFDGDTLSGEYMVAPRIRA